MVTKIKITPENQVEEPPGPAYQVGESGPTGRRLGRLGNFLKKTVWPWVRPLTILLVLAFISWTLYHNWQELWQNLGGANWGWLFLALGLNLLGSLIYVVVWENCSRQLKAHGGLAGALIGLSMAGAARYLPGGIWPVAGLIYFAPHVGLSRRQMPLWGALSQLVHLISAGLVGIAGFCIVVVLTPAPASPQFWLAALLGLGTGLAVIAGLPRYAAPFSPQINSLTLGVPALVSALFWLVNGLRLLVMVWAFAPAGWQLLPYLVCAGAITTLVSALFFFVPLGLGVVELSLGWWLAQVVPWPLALTLVALNRLFRTINDGFYFGLGLALVHKKGLEPGTGRARGHY